MDHRTPVRPRSGSPTVQHRGPGRWLRGHAAPECRLPTSGSDLPLVAGVLADVRERPDRAPIDPLLARSVWDEVEYLTRASGVLHVTMTALADRVNAARARLPGGTGRAGLATRTKVAAVVRRMVAAGWLVEVRKTCRMAVFAVAQPGPVATAGATAQQSYPRSTPSSPSESKSRLQSENNSSLGTRLADREALRAADQVLAEHLARLRCKGTSGPGAVGAWRRYLVARLRWFSGPELSDEVARYRQALRALSDRHETVWLSEATVLRHLPRT